MNIIVTGTSKGIGKEICLHFANNSQNNIIAISRTPENPFEGNENIRYISFDLNVIDKLLNLINDIASTMKNVDILINNAGLLINKPFDKLTSDDYDLLLNTNLKSPFFFIQHLLPMLNVGSHIVNISSMGGFQGSVKFPGLSLYSASKGALAILSECLSTELRDSEISVNALALGAVQTEMLHHAFPDYTAPINPEGMAKFICDFTQDAHHYINGKVIPVTLSTP